MGSLFTVNKVCTETRAKFMFTCLREEILRNEVYMITGYYVKEHILVVTSKAKFSQNSILKKNVTA